jgi:uncharacterized protein YkwD
MNRLHSFVLGFLLLVLVGAGVVFGSAVDERRGQLRSWTDKDGRTIQAYLKGTKGEGVLLVKDGKEYLFPVSRLSRSDRAYLNDWLESPNPNEDARQAETFPVLSDKELETAPPLSVELLKKKVFDLTNDERKAMGIIVLKAYEELDSVARLHSEDMSVRGFFAHHNPDGDSPTDRARKAGFSGLVKSPDGKLRPGLSENIARVGRYSSIRQSVRNEKVVSRRIGWQKEDDLARQIVRGLLNSPEHKKNILDPTKAYLGVGIYVFREHVFVTQNFF